MITLFNRRKLMITVDPRERERVQDILEQEGIAYRLQTVTRTNPTAITTERERDGSFGQHQEMVQEFLLYVAKEDFDRAAEALRR